MQDKALQEIKRGEEAARVLNNELYQEAFTRVRDNIVQTMESSPLGDDKTHNRLVIALQVLGQIDKALKEVMQTGQMAQIQIKEKSRFNPFG